MGFVKATVEGGALKPIDGCSLIIPKFGDFPGKEVFFNILPDISDSKTASYSTDLVMGRSSPMKSYVASDERQIGIVFHFIVAGRSDIYTNIETVRMIQAMAYPRDSDDKLGVPFIPPPVCSFWCGRLLSSSTNRLCVVLKNYSLKIPTDVAWDADLLCPVKFDLDTNWDVVYASSELPGANKIIKFWGS